jgi:glycosyltransferase involved in cell wall biosynthesis
MQPKVSIVIPVYNKIKYIREMLDSVLVQVWDNIEVILVNDGATDGTRVVLTEYDSKFHKRGYKVVIIDQENQGVAGAVRTGLMNVTGKYVCTPDCDDRLHPKYVSTMAGYLEEHPSEVWVACDLDLYPFDLSSAIGLKREFRKDIRTYTDHLLERVMLQRFNLAVWTKMLRTGIMQNLLNFDTYIVNRFSSQEYQITYPIAAKIKTITHIPKVLYYWRSDNSRNFTINASEYYPIIHRADDFNSAKIYYENNNKVAVETLKLCNQNDHIIGLQEIRLTHFIIQLMHQFDIDDKELCRAEADKFNRQLREYNLLLPSALGNREINFDNIVVFFQALGNAILGCEGIIEAIAPLPGGRIIGYGALGRGAKGLLPAVLDSPLRPDLLWDAAAQEDSQRFGIKVTKPDFDNLTETDIVLVFLKKAQIAEEVSNLLEATAAKGNIYYYYDVIDYLAKTLFPNVTAETINYHS